MVMLKKSPSGVPVNVSGGGGGALGLATLLAPGGVPDMNWNVNATPGQYVTPDAPVGAGLAWQGSADFRAGLGLAAGGVEYIGAAAPFVLVVCTASLLPDAWNITSFTGLGLAINNDLVGATTQQQAALEAGALAQLLHAGVLGPGDGPTNFNGVTMRLVQVTPGDFVTPVVSTDSALTLAAQGLTIALFALA